jgi:hypothetical protein
MTDDYPSLEAKVQRLLDIEEIKTLRSRYAYGANIIGSQPGDLKAFAGLFAQDGTFDVGMGVATGPAEIEAMMRSLTTQWKSAMHYMLNPLIELDGDRATAKFTGLFAFHGSADSSPIWLCNIYDDSYVRTAEGWRFQSVRIETIFADAAFFEGYADQLVTDQA